jgi:hypothetical protein
VAKGTTTIDEETKRNPALGRVTYNEVVETAKKIVKEQDGKFTDDKQKATFTTMLGQWLSSNQFDPSRKAELDRFREVVLAPAFQQLLGQLDPVDRSKALSPLFARVRQQVPEDIGQVRKMVEAFNALPASKEYGMELSLSYDSVAGLVSAKTANTSGMMERQYSTTPGGAVTGMTRGAQWRGNTPSGEQRNLLQQIEGRLNWLNTVPHVLESTLPLVSGDKTVNSFQSRTEIWRGLKEGGEVNLFEGKMRDAVGVPRNSAPNPTTPADWQAINAREAAKAPEREADAIRLRKMEGVTATDASQLKAALSVKSLKPEVRSILERELRLVEGALALP